MKVILVNQSDRAMPRKFLQQLVQLIFVEFGKHPQIKDRIKLLPSETQELTLVFLNSAPAKKLNLTFRKKNYPTDVLSFSSKSIESLGELILCPQVIKKQSLENGVKFREELAYMVLHGILHLLGYEHEKSVTQARLMFKIQDEVFKKLAVHY